jgi:cytidylate kinase
MKTSLLEVFSRYLQAQAALPERARQPQPLAITISREVGAGGLTIAELLGQRLTAEKTPTASPWAVFSANLAKQVLEDHKLPLDLERFMAEDARLPVEAIVEEVLGLHPSGWTLVQHTTQTILRLAGLGHTILVGRGASVITARLPNVFHVRLVAPLATRVRHAAEYHHLSEAEAAKLVREQDQARRRYLRRHFNAEIDDPILYDVTLNTGRLGFARTAEGIAQLALQHHHAFAERERAKLAG